MLIYVFITCSLTVFVILFSLYQFYVFLNIFVVKLQSSTYGYSTLPCYINYFLEKPKQITLLWLFCKPLFSVTLFSFMISFFVAFKLVEFKFRIVVLVVYILTGLTLITTPPSVYYKNSMLFSFSQKSFLQAYQSLTLPTYLIFTLLFAT
jgi:hypothetical protein